MSARLAGVLAAATLLAGCLQGGDERPRASRAAPAQPGSSAPGYTVRGGDTLSGIAARLGVEMQALARANGLAPPYLIRVGQRLAIPRREAMAAIRTESRPVIQPLPRQRSPEVVPPRAAPAPANAQSTALAPRLAWPADGPLGSRFGEGADGRGIAITAHEGAAVRAAAAGTVLFAGPEPKRFGRLVLLDHGGGWVSAYGNLARLVVREGEALRGGARLGFVAAPALHFELRRDNVAIDPVPLLPPRF